MNQRERYPPSKKCREWALPNEIFDNHASWEETGAVRILGNILWFILGGLLAAILYIVGGLLLCLTIIGIPFGIQAFKLAGLSLAPFGKQVVYGEKVTGCVAVCMNILWVLVGGFWIAVVHLVFAGICAITIVLLPFAQQHIKLMALAFAPFGVELKQFDDHPNPFANPALPRG
ncbi:MAG: YccF domain-containing protein [Verrucomicrobiota bacterium]